MATTLRPLLLTATGSIAVLGAALAIRAAPEVLAHVLPACASRTGAGCAPSPLSPTAVPDPVRTPRP
ncbi:hypothetical protein [Streptosporangium fragile]|uniref:hypothetical protein n=1 Tax=Streptosporangium fragile TaxID=46186 RepID=UPI0031EAC88B